MGYQTDFEGRLELSEQLPGELFEYINRFNKIRHMKRDPELVAKMPDPIREAAGIPLGENAEFFVGELGHGYESYDDSVIDGNLPPLQNLGLWCHWELVEEDGKHYLQWDEAEKFYEYLNWLDFFYDSFFEPNGITLTGKIRWRGEDFDDVGCIQADGGRPYSRQLT